MDCRHARHIASCFFSANRELYWHEEKTVKRRISRSVHHVTNRRAGIKFCCYRVLISRYYRAHSLLKSLFCASFLIALVNGISRRFATPEILLNSLLPSLLLLNAFHRSHPKAMLPRCRHLYSIIYAVSPLFTRGATSDFFIRGFTLISYFYRPVSS